jgi:hypothetical protein
MPRIEGDGGSTCRPHRDGIGIEPHDAVHAARGLRRKPIDERANA